MTDLKACNHEAFRRPGIEPKMNRWRKGWGGNWMTTTSARKNSLATEIGVTGARDVNVKGKEAKIVDVEKGVKWR